MVWLYVIGAAFVLMGCIVSVYPPKSRPWQAVSVACFFLIFYFGYLVTTEQAKRAQNASDQVQKAQQEAKDKETEVNGKLDGVLLAIESIAKGSQSSPKWDNLVSQLRAMQSAPASSSTSPTFSSNLGCASSIGSCSNEQLLERAQNLQSHLKGFLGEWSDAERTLQAHQEQTTKNSPPGPEHEADRAKHYSDERWNLTVEYQNRYAKDYRDEAVAVRNEIIARVPGSASKTEYSWFDKPYNSTGVYAAITDLQLLIEALRQAPPKRP